MYRFTALESPYVRYSVYGSVNGVTIDPTLDVVKFAFTQQGTDPTGPDWKVGSWETWVGPPKTYIARIQIGPSGTVALAKGVYTAWIWVADSPEQIIRPLGQVTIA